MDGPQDNVFVVYYDGVVYKDTGASATTATQVPEILPNPPTGSASYGIAVDANDNIFWTDVETASVYELNHATRAIGTVTYPPQGVYFPTGLAVDSSGGVYTFDNRTFTVIRHNPDGTATPLPIAPLTHPTNAVNGYGLVVDARGDVFVDDYYAGTVIELPTAPCPQITTTSLPSGTVGTSYSAALTASGSGPLTWSVASGSLPPGLALNGSTVSGTPTTVGTFTFTAEVANGFGDTTTTPLSISIAPAGPPSIQPFGVTNADGPNATFTGQINPAGTEVDAVRVQCKGPGHVTMQFALSSPITMAQPVTVTVTGFQPGVAYSCTMSAINNQTGVVATSTTVQVTTNPASITSFGTSNVFQTTADFEAFVNPNGFQVDSLTVVCHGPGQPSIQVPYPSPKTVAREVSLLQMTGLRAGTSYTCTMTAINSQTGVVVRSQPITFTTQS